MGHTKIIIAENQDIYRSGIVSILKKRNDFEIVDCVKSGADLIKSYRKNPESVCVISSSLTDSNIHDLMKELKKIHQSVQAIVITQSNEMSHLHQALKAGVMGYLTKNVSENELFEIITTVSNGNQAFGRSISELMVGKYADIAQRSKSISKKNITKREREVLKLIVEGYTSAEIAKRLYISVRTVETHRSNLMNKLELKNTAALVRYALEEKQES
jgi:DNA-binding NarL/FixJ family response regulator